MVESAAPDAEVASPCIGVCRVDGQDVCIGCGRTIDEICSWLKAGLVQRRQIVARAAQRRAERRESPA